jgi:hypothetical protein
MTKDDIIRMARETGVLSGFEGEPDNLVRFAELVAAAEREACAKVCDDWLTGRDDVYLIGKAIRARGQK